MNEVSIIINGVRYDAVKAEHRDEEVCEKCDLAKFCDDIPYILTLCQVLDTSDEDIHFKKSNKSFEK